jgi:List-Bact-rpt repeat protein
MLRPTLWMVVLFGCSSGGGSIEPPPDVPLYTFAIRSLGDGFGTVRATASTGPALTCVITAGVVAATGCGGSYDSGTVVTLAATNGAGSSFQSWDVTSCGSGNPCAVKLAGSLTVGAAFTLDAVAASVIVSPPPLP